MMRRQQGYTYLGVLLLVMVLGMSLTGAALVSEVMQQREKERELIFSGEQYADAIKRYYEAGAGGVSTFPRSVADLLKDPRFPAVRRYLRRPLRDPMTPSGEWELIRDEQGGIVGVRSRSVKTPLGQYSGEQVEDLVVGKKKTYRDWQFRHDPGAMADSDQGSGGSPLSPGRPAGAAPAGPRGLNNPLDAL
jgi:type II secretory pathway pseudopilin PulG